MLDEVTLNDYVDNSNGMFAIMIENEDGEYVEYSGESFPTDMIFNDSMSSCLDDNGQTVEGILSFSDGMATVETGDTVYCYLYFDLDDSDLRVTVMTDDTKSSVPITGSYTVTTTSGSYWSERYRTLNITSTSSTKAKYTLTFTTDTSAKTYLRDYIVSLAGTTSGNGYLIDEGDAGYRYEGANPNNYVWFNNEMWRIIGVIPTKTSSETVNLVKIIRKNSIGNFAYDAESGNNTNVWGSNTLYTLLNSFYWGASDGTGSDGCVHTSEIYLFPNCDYTNIGINSTSYYGSMVQYVYWNTGTSAYNVTPSTAYANETATQTVGGYVGIMNASDYGYAAYSTNHSTTMYMYSTTGLGQLDWLLKVAWTMTGLTSLSTNSAMISSNGVLSNNGTSNNYGVYPVVYLNLNVYIADGTGSESDPYILGID